MPISTFRPTMRPPNHIRVFPRICAEVLSLRRSSNSSQV